MVVVISAHLPTEHSLFHAHVPISATEVLLSQHRACVEQFTGYAIRQITSYGQFRQHLKTHLFMAYKSQRIVTLDYCALYKYSYLLTCSHVCTVGTAKLWWPNTSDLTFELVLHVLARRRVIIE